MSLKSSVLLSLAIVATFVSAVVSASQVIIPAPPQSSATAHLLLDAHTGKVLAENNADTTLPPASLTKMMTIYIVASEIARGGISANDQVNVSVKAWKMGGSRMFIREGTQVSVSDLMRGVIVQSGNDASIALAEHVAGSEEAFVDIMNQQAALLGMTNTRFQNATGWPHQDHYTSARDLSLLARALINDYPEQYKIYSEKYFSYNGINQTNRNKLLFRDDTVDGIKTGHTDEAGYCLVASAQRDNMRLISVVMGTASESARAAESQKLLAYGFRYYKTHKLYGDNEVVSTARVWKGQLDTVSLAPSNAVYLTISRGAEDQLVAEVAIDSIIEAPVVKGQELGNVTVTLDGDQLLDMPLSALENVDQAGFFSRLLDSIKLFFFKLFN